MRQPINQTVSPQTRQEQQLDSLVEGYGRSYEAFKPRSSGVPLFSRKAHVLIGTAITALMFGAGAAMLRAGAAQADYQPIEPSSIPLTGLSDQNPPPQVPASVTLSAPTPTPPSQ